MIPLQVMAIVLTGAAATAVVAARDAFRQALVLGIYGFALVVLFVVFQAPDVALSALVVGSVAFPFVILAALSKLR